MTKMADFSVTSTVDFSDIERRLTDAERQVLVRHGDIIKKAILARWTDWAYEGRPKDAPVNVSRKAWTRKVTTTESKATLTISNEARDWRTGTKAYVAYVHRAGKREIEVDVIAAEMEATYYPALVTELTAVVRATLNAPKQPKKLRSTGTTGRVRGRTLGA